MMLSGAIAFYGFSLALWGRVGPWLRRDLIVVPLVLRVLV
jgi:hypothetical protein